MKIFDLVSLVKASEGLRAGATGTIVYLYLDGKACEVEFVTPRISKVITLSLNQVERKRGEYEN